LREVNNSYLKKILQIFLVSKLIKQIIKSQSQET